MVDSDGEDYGDEAGVDRLQASNLVGKSGKTKVRRQGSKGKGLKKKKSKGK